jgi:hypothetical protein
MEVRVTVLMTSYIAHPYWPARNRVIEIEKKSGMNRQKSDDKRQAALKAECERQGYTLAQYEQFKIEAAEPWYRNGDRTIIIPRHQLAGAFVQAIGTAPKSLRGPFDKDNFRSQVTVGDFATNRADADGLFCRFAKLEGSNQRSYQENEFIGRAIDHGKEMTGSPFTANGVIDIPNPKHVDVVKALLVAVVETIGIGASRKMGFGRGKVKSWDVCD